ncbi:MAG: phosphohydrolase, partial [Planctomycetota bacterium]
MRCPGQDPRYWKEDAVFETPCPKCDNSVEFFKDEGARRCSRCGYRFPNPKISFDCAQWCAYAEQCLGFVPEREALSNPGEGALASRLIQEIKGAFENDQARIARALTVFQHARELLSKEGGDPRIILAAALLVELAADPREPA